MKVMLWASVLAISTGEASALDCLFGDAAMAFEQAKSNGEPFRAVVGTMTWQAPEIQILNGYLMMEYEGQEYDVPARFVGVELLANGESVPVEHDIHVHTWCANGDCGYASANVEMLTFLQDTDFGIVMNSYPCQSYPIGASAANIDAVQNCLDGGPCSGAWE